MEFVRQIVNANTLKPIFALPPSFHDIQVEVIILPVHNEKTSPIDPSSHSISDVSVKAVRHSAFGRLKPYANPSLIPEEESAWEKATTAKYDLH